VRTNTAFHWHENRHIQQWNIIDDPEINLHSYSYLIFHKCDKSISWRKDSLFTNNFRKKGYPHVED
jgi:hypothetical protein